MNRLAPNASPSLCATVRRLAGIWALLILLLLGSLTSAYVPLGSGNLLIGLLVALAKSALVAWFFMHLRDSAALVRLAAGAALFILLLLFALSGIDYATRTVYRAPWQIPRQAPTSTVE